MQDALLLLEKEMEGSVNESATENDAHTDTQSLEQSNDAEADAHSTANLSPKENDTRADMAALEQSFTDATDETESQSSSDEVHSYQALPNTYIFDCYRVGLTRFV